MLSETSPWTFVEGIHSTMVDAHLQNQDAQVMNYGMSITVKVIRATL